MSAISYYEMLFTTYQTTRRHDLILHRYEHLTSQSGRLHSFPVVCLMFATAGYVNLIGYVASIWRNVFND
jgi:hypothetical protein